MDWDIASFTDKGERPINEDCIDIISSAAGVCVVLCDGLGGHESGELASQCVCASIRKSFEAAAADSSETELLKTMLDMAQQELLRQQEELGKQRGMRTTVCCMVLRDGKCSAAYVGDSRIYQFRDGCAIARTQDHSVPQYLVNIGEITEKDIRHHPDRNKLIRVMGSEWEKPMYQLPDFSQPKPGDAYLLCSDGFWDWIDEKSMEKCLMSSETSEQWIDAMQKTVLGNGKGNGMDNYSAIVLRSLPGTQPEKSFFQKIFKYRKRGSRI